MFHILKRGSGLYQGGFSTFAVDKSMNNTMNRQNLLILLCIEIFKDDYKVTSNFLAGSINVNPVIVRNILGLLSSAGIVEIKAGIGGASLAKSPDEITMLDVFKAVEKEEALFHFHENPNSNCPVGRNVHRVLDSKLDNIQTVMENELAKITLIQLIKETKEKIQS